MMKQDLTLNSKLREIVANPVGHDVAVKLLTQMGLPSRLARNPLLGGLRLKQLKALFKQLDPGFFDAVLNLLNSEKDTLDDSRVEPKRAWWKEAVFYQIYPRSFMDSNGDGVGDLRGILSKLDYLKALGVDAVWLSPIYDSPCDDNGYDIRDYQKILPEFGSMDDFDALLGGLHERGMKLIMDLVLNHTSDEHPWFTEALQSESSPKRDFYFFRKGRGKKPPNNWTSFFGGPAWNFYPGQDVFALHLFSKKQMDLNWDCPALREEIYGMVRWWLEKGVDGFRLDVINYISKPAALPDGNAFIGSLMGFSGIEHYFAGPRLHEYLRELRTKAFAPYGAFSVGETPGAGEKIGRLLTDDTRGELDLIFSFDHLETPGHTRFDEYAYDLSYLKRFYIERLNTSLGHGWDTLFYDNHDNPRMLSKIDPPGAHRFTLAKLLGVLQMTLCGTPFLYQGQELGAVNKVFSSIGDLRDVESLNLYEDLIKTMPADDALRRVLAGTRDHARTPMQWNDSKNAGFTTGTPWIDTDGDEKLCNAEQQLEDEYSVLRFYQRLTAIRRASKAFIYGQTEYIDPKANHSMRYIRRLGEEAYYIECNLGASETKHKAHGRGGSTLVLSNYEDETETLRAYEARVYRVS